MKHIHPTPLPVPRAVTIEEDDGFAHFIEVSAVFGEITLRDVQDEDGRRLRMQTVTMTPAQAEALGNALVAVARGAVQ